VICFSSCSRQGSTNEPAVQESGRTNAESSADAPKEHAGEHANGADRNTPKPERWTYEFRLGQKYPIAVFRIKSCNGDVIAFLTMSYGPPGFSLAMSEVETIKSCRCYRTIAELAEDLASLPATTPVYALNRDAIELKHNDPHGLLTPIDDHHIDAINARLNKTWVDVCVTREDGSSQFDIGESEMKKP